MRRRPVQRSSPVYWAQQQQRVLSSNWATKSTVEQVKTEGNVEPPLHCTALHPFSERAGSGMYVELCARADDGEDPLASDDDECVWLRRRRRLSSGMRLMLGMLGMQALQALQRVLEMLGMRCGRG